MEPFWLGTFARQLELSGAPQRDPQAEADSVLLLLNQLSEKTLLAAIEGISAWLDAWRNQVVSSALSLPVWLRIWPIAVDATNAGPDNADDDNLNITVRSSNDDQEPMDLDTLNTPAGKLVGVFLKACPSLKVTQNPFSPETDVRLMRDE